MRSPSTSQRRSPPSSIANTIARSRCVRSAPSSASTSTGDNTFGSVRGVRINGTPRAPEASGRRVAQPARHRVTPHLDIVARQQIREKP